MSRPDGWNIAWAFILCASLFAGCNSDAGTDNEATDQPDTTDTSASENREISSLAGKVVIDGSSTVFPISEAAANKFRKSYPNVKITVATSGTGGGFKRFTVGDTDISDASRPIKDKEFARCKENNVVFIEIPVAYDGLTVVVNNDNNWAEDLTVEDLQRIFLEANDKPTNWKDVKDGYPDEPLKIYSPGTDSGTFDYFKEVVVGDEKSKAMRSDMSVSEDDNVLVTGVANEKGGVGFFGCAYYFENKGKLRSVKIINADGEAVAPTPETIESGTYNPLSRPLFIYLNARSVRRPEMKKFVEYYLENAGDLASDVGYVALPAAVYERAVDHYKNRKIGTHFWTADGKKRSGPLPELYVEENLVN